MKMLYRPSKLHSVSPSKPLLLWVCVLLAVLLAVFKPPVPRLVSNGIISIAQPAWRVRDNVSEALTNVRATFTTRTQRNSYIEELESELERMRRETYARSDRPDEERVRELALETHIPATMLVDLRSSSMDRGFVDRGERDGLAERMLVVTPEGLAVGYIERTYARTSVVSLFSYAGVQTNVLLQGEPSTPSILYGEGAGTMRMLIPRDIDIPLKTVVTLPNDQRYVIGYVADIRTTPEDAFQTVYVRSFVSLFTVRDVVIDVTAIWEPASPLDLEEGAASST